MNNIPGIFNDVIGPVMRGPSSSHTAASWRIARVCLDILNEPLKKAVIEFDKEGAWAANYMEQGTVMGIDGGLLGINIIDDKMKHTESLAKEIGVVIRYEINSFPTKHTNTVRLTLEGKNGKKVQFVKLTPIDSDSEVSFILVGIELKSNHIYQIIEIGTNETRTILTASNIKTNQKIDEGLFLFDERKYEELNYMINK